MPTVSHWKGPKLEMTSSFILHIITCCSQVREITVKKDILYIPHMELDRGSLQIYYNYFYI